MSDIDWAEDLWDESNEASAHDENESCQERIQKGHVYKSDYYLKNSYYIAVTNCLGEYLFWCLNRKIMMSTVASKYVPDHMIYVGKFENVYILISANVKDFGK